MSRARRALVLTVLASALLVNSAAQAQRPWVIWVVDFERAVTEVEAGKAALARAKAYEEKRIAQGLNINEVVFLANELEVQRERELEPVREQLRAFVFAEAEKNQVHWVFDAREVAFARQGHDVTAKMVAAFNAAKR